MAEEYLSGLQKVTENIRQAADKIEHGASEGLAYALMFVAAESQQRAPVDTGDLRGSVQVSMDDTLYAIGNPGGGMSQGDAPPEKATVGTVSYNAKYAAAQHEHTEYDHPRGGQAKYLESVLVQHKQRILRLIADGIAEKMEG